MVGLERLDQVIIRTRIECSLQIRYIRARGNKKDEYLVAVRLRAELPAKFETAFARQHPIENQEWEILRRHSLFGFLGTAYRHDLVSPSLN